MTEDTNAGNKRARFYIKELENSFATYLSWGYQKPKITVMNGYKYTSELFGEDVEPYFENKYMVFALDKPMEGANQDAGGFTAGFPEKDIAAQIVRGIAYGLVSDSRNHISYPFIQTHQSWVDKYSTETGATAEDALKATIDHEVYHLAYLATNSAPTGLEDGAAHWAALQQNKDSVFLSKGWLPKLYDYKHAYSLESTSGQTYAAYPMFEAISEKYGISKVVDLSKNGFDLEKTFGAALPGILGDYYSGIAQHNFSAKAASLSGNIPNLITLAPTGNEIEAGAANYFDASNMTITSKDATTAILFEKTGSNLKEVKRYPLGKEHIISLDAENTSGVIALISPTVKTTYSFVEDVPTDTNLNDNKPAGNTSNGNGGSFDACPSCDWLDTSIKATNVQIGLACSVNGIKVSGQQNCDNQKKQLEEYQVMKACCAKKGL